MLRYPADISACTHGPLTGRPKQVGTPDEQELRGWFYRFSGCSAAKANRTSFGVDGIIYRRHTGFSLHAQWHSGLVLTAVPTATSPAHSAHLCSREIGMAAIAGFVPASATIRRSPSRSATGWVVIEVRGCLFMTARTLQSGQTASGFASQFAGAVFWPTWCPAAAAPDQRNHRTPTY